MKRLLWYPCRAWWWLWQPIQSGHCPCPSECLRCFGPRWLAYLAYVFGSPIFVFFWAYKFGGGEPPPLPKPKAVGTGALTLQDKGGEVSHTGTGVS